jgi:hypothetical protein
LIIELEFLILNINNMKKSILTLAIVAFLTSMSGFAQEEQPKQKKKKAKTEKSCSTDEKKSCGAGEKKGGCCSKGGAEKK